MKHYLIILMCVALIGATIGCSREESTLNASNPSTLSKRNARVTYCQNGTLGYNFVYSDFYYANNDGCYYYQAKQSNGYRNRAKVQVSNQSQFAKTVTIRIRSQVPFDNFLQVDGSFTYTSDLSPQDDPSGNFYYAIKWTVDVPAYQNKTITFDVYVPSTEGVMVLDLISPCTLMQGDTGNYCGNDDRYYIIRSSN